MTQEELEKLNNPVNTNQVTGKNSPIHTLIAKNFLEKLTAPPERTRPNLVRALPEERERKHLPTVSRGLTSPQTPVGGSALSLLGLRFNPWLGNRPRKSCSRARKGKQEWNSPSFFKETTMQTSMYCGPGGAQLCVTGLYSWGSFITRTQDDLTLEKFPPVVPFIWMDGEKFGKIQQAFTV